MTDHDRIETALRNPIAWVSSGIISVITVMVSIGFDPFGIVATVLTVIFSQATNLFTAGSIMGFTVAPEISWLPAWPIQAAAIGLGLIVVGKIVSGVWDRFKARVMEG